jgi:Flp pilus assembly pilin Flp
MTRTATRPSGQAARAGARVGTIRQRALESRGQAFAEYLTLSGVIAVIVVASMAAFNKPVAMTFAALCRRLVLYVTSPS